MFYKFNNITQNVAAASQDVSFGKPISPQAFSTNLKEAPETHYEFKPMQASKEAAVRHASSKAATQGPGKYLVPNHPWYKQLMEKQTLFTRQDGKLVWQKLPKDMPLYYGIVAACAVGLLQTLYTLKKMSDPPKNQ